MPDGADRHLIWDDEPGGNVEHIAEHDISPEEVEDVVRNPDNEPDVSHSSGYPVTAYEVPERRS